MPFAKKVVKKAPAALKKTATKTATKKVSPEVEAAPAKKKGFPPRKAGSQAAPKRKPLPIFKAPTDFRPHFLLVSIATEKDGLLGTSIKAIRYQGRFDREVEDKKKFDMSSYDPSTVIGIQARLAAVTYRTNPEKKFPEMPAQRVDLKGAHRLPANAQFQILLRIGKKSADQSVTTSVKQIWQILKSPKTGRVGAKELEKTDPAYRAIRKVSRILPASFKAVLMPPKRGRKQVEEE